MTASLEQKARWAAALEQTRQQRECAMFAARMLPQGSEERAKQVRVARGWNMTVRTYAKAVRTGEDPYPPPSYD